MTLSEQIISKIKPQFEGDSSGHDWFHIDRVYKMALYLQKHEGGDLMTIEAAALLHDISDYKLNGGKLNEGGKIASEILCELGCDEEFIRNVSHIIDNVSYKGAETETNDLSLEGQIVQDADRLDAIGAIGIARVFAYGGKKGQAMYDPELKPVMHKSFESYANSKTSSINHFYEKLLLLTSRLHTKTAKEIGNKRHQLMENYLNDFYSEWDVKIE